VNIRKEMYSGREFLKATENDIYYCYRLLLNREPDKNGFGVHHSLLSHGVTLQALSDNFLMSDEFIAKMCGVNNLVKNFVFNRISGKRLYRIRNYLYYRYLNHDKKFDRISSEDIRYCYRIFLKREPDEKGLRNYSSLIPKHVLRDLVGDFLNSPEFSSVQLYMNEPELIDLGPFIMYVRKNDFWIGYRIYSTKEYEPHVSQALRSVLKPGMVFLDIGANIGYFTLLASSMIGDQGKVISFEPNPENVRFLRKSIKANKYNNIDLFQYAIADKKQILSLEIGGASSNGMLKEVSLFNKIVRKNTIKTVALDNFLGEQEIDVVKLDIEGAEPLALKGMMRLVKKNNPVIFLEFTPNLIQRISGISSDDFLDILFGLGYEISIINELTGETSKPMDKNELLTHCIKKEAHADLVLYPVHK